MLSNGQCSIMRSRSDSGKRRSIQQRRNSSSGIWENLENWTKRFRKTEFEIRKPRKQIIDRTDSDSNKYRRRYFFMMSQMRPMQYKKKIRRSPEREQINIFFQKNIGKILKKLHFRAYLGISSSIITMKI